MKRLICMLGLALAASLATAQQAPERSPGLTVLGKEDTPLGVSIVPWRNAAAEGGDNRPARLLNEALRPLDTVVFDREMRFHDALSGHLEAAGRQVP